MKKILSLLLLSSSLFSMELHVARPSKFNTQYKSSDINKAAFAQAITPYTPPSILSKVTIVDEIDVRKVLIQPSSVHVPHNLQGLKLYHSKKGFVALCDNKTHIIDLCLVDKTARNMTQEQLKSFLKLGYFAINQSNDGSLSLKAHDRSPGGGVIGASIGAFLGKAAVYVIGHGAIQIVAICTGPAYPVTVLALEGCFAVPIETASMAGAIAGGMIGAVATGPV